MLATLSAEAGYPALRFDPPGCGDSLGDLAVVGGMGALADAAVDAVGELRRRALVERVVLIGHGLGAVVAAQAAPRVGAEALAVLAPPSSGRAHLRELALWGRWIAQGLGLAPGDAETEGVGGFRLPLALRTSIAGIDLSAVEAAPAPTIFLAARPRCLADVQLAEHWRARGADLTVADYD